ncbi:MAG: 5-formyltetrahydrofolate cyclo-ligase [Clostridia bacterium]|nr:5-formyltetrahydrofolate cyclo-ligase [Clostridia bacterium]
MAQITDIREYKKNLRTRYKNERLKLSPTEKQNLDEGVFNRFLKLNQYASSTTILAYVSTNIEVDTRKIIERALEDGKRVAVPYCVPDTRLLEFYLIDSLDDLMPGAFGVLEPTPDPEKRLIDWEKSLCVVPGLCFDFNGYRLGFGKGYYDRFLSEYTGIRVGICYSSGVRGHLHHGRYDRTVDVLVTEKNIKSIHHRKPRFAKDIR